MRLPDNALSFRSLPAWEHELKPLITTASRWYSHRSLRVSVNWNSWKYKKTLSNSIAPYVGAWVETSMIKNLLLYVGLLPTWERELKRIKPISQIKEEQLLPPWERELKPSLLKCFTAAIYYRFLQGSVSWNSDKTFKSEALSALMILRNSLVALYVGACVERSIIPLVRDNFLYVGLCVEINVQY